MPFECARTWIGGLLGLLALGLGTAARADCPVGPSFGGEDSLQVIFDDMFGTGDAPEVIGNCMDDPGDALWRTVDAVGSATILVEVAGNANGNSFGMYDSSNHANSLQIFNGPAGAASTAYITISGGPGAYLVTIDRFQGGTHSGTVTGTFGSSIFGFYMEQPGSAGGERFYSESFRNLGQNGDPARDDYLYSYTGNGALFLAGSVYAPDSVEGTTFGPNDAILAWEDLRSNTDGDFQDMVVLVRDIVPIPLPAAAWLLLSGLSLAGFAGRRRKTVIDEELNVALAA